MSLDTMIDAPEMTEQEFRQAMGFPDPTPEPQPIEPSLTGKVRRFYDGLAKEEQIAKLLKDNPEYITKLEQQVQQTYDKYQKNLEATSTKINTGLKGLGLAGDAYFFYDPIGGLGIKAVSTVGRTLAELPNMLNYVVKARDPLMGLGWATMKAASYLPLLTIIDGGMKGIVRDRIYKEARKEFLKEIGENYKRPSVLEPIKNSYRAIKNLFGKKKEEKQQPVYQPTVA